MFSHVTLLLLVSVAAPFIEETFFRGAFFQAARLRLGVAPAIALTGLMFGLAHPVGIAEAVTLASMGSVFAWLAYKRKSLAPGMVAHCMQNSFSYFTLYFTFLVVHVR